MRAAIKNYGSINAIYKRNYDGDTLTVNIPAWPSIIGKKIPIRINGIDAPEIRSKSKETKKLAKEAKKTVQRLLKNTKSLELRNMKRGKYFRIVADVYADKVNVAKFLLKNKLAVPYNGGTKKHKNKSDTIPFPVTYLLFSVDQIYLVAISGF